MSTWVALLRGINVGGNNPLPMADLTAVLQGLGLSDVRTYIQSGNAVFRGPKAAGPALAERISEAIAARQGFRPDILVLSGEELEQAAAANPFPEAEAEPKALHLFFLAQAPLTPDLAALNGCKADSERFALRESVFYLHAPDGIGRSKLAARVERCLGVATTARNWRSVAKILDMARHLNERPRGG